MFYQIFHVLGWEINVYVLHNGGLSRKDGGLYPIYGMMGS
jgi:hypothetical protein